MADSIRSMLPAALSHLLGPAFDEPVFVETRASCDNCAMCDRESDTAAPGDDFFRPDLKCCTYHPVLPNYLIGGLLADPDPGLAEGQRRVRAKIAKRFGVTPRWLAPERMHRVIYDAARSHAFGRAPSLACPYLNEGQCSVWRHREAVCSTFYCKHVAGAKGKGFWNALKAYLSLVEVGLAHWSATTIFPGAQEPTVSVLSLTLQDLQNLPPTDADYTAFWGEWVGREEEFYVACHEKVCGLTRANLARLVDDTPKGKEALDELVARYETAARPKPTELLVLNPSMRKVAHNGGFAVRTYSGYDPMFLTNDLHDVLSEFSQAEPAADTIKRLDVEVPSELLEKLWLHEILLTPSTECQPAPKLSLGDSRCVSSRAAAADPSLVDPARAPNLGQDGRVASAPAPGETGESTK